MTDRKSAPALRRNTETPREDRVAEAEATLERELGLLWWVHSLSYVLVTRVQSSITERHGLSILEWRIILSLARLPGLSANEVIELWGLQSMAVSRAVRRLVKIGLVIRIADPDGSRRMPMRLSEAGQELHDAAWPDAATDYRKVLSVLSASERKVYRELSRKLLRQAQTVMGTR